MDRERKAFEEWSKIRFEWGADGRPYHGALALCHAARQQWEGWQARAALDAPQAGPAVEACPSCGLADPLLHPCDASGHASPCNDAFHRTVIIRKCAEPGCEVVGLTKRVEWRCVPHMDPPAPQAEPVMWAIRDRHGAYSNETRAEEQIRAVCDYLNRDPSEAHYIARGPYEVVPLVPLVRGDE